MGTISQKLTYLNDTKQLLKENINNLGGNLTTEPFRQYASVLEGIYESLPKVSGIGASLSLSPSLMGKIKLNEIQGDTLQDGTPTPSSPVPIQSVTGLQNVEVCGKNMLDYSTMVDGNVTSTGTIFPNTSNGEMCSDFIKVKPNTTYTFKIFETSSPYDNWFGVGEYTSNNENSFIQRDTTNNVSQNYITFTTTATTNYVRLSGRNLKSATKVQFELGNATTYEAYNESTYNINIGKNLINLYAVITSGHNGLKGTYNSDGSFTMSGTTTGTYSNLTNNTSCNYPAGTYVFSRDKSVPYRTYLTLKLSNGTDNNTVIIDSNQTSVIFTTQYEILSYRLSAANLKNNTTYNETFKFQFEKGSTPTSFSPYFTPIELNKIGEYENHIFKNEPSNPLYDDTLTLNSWYLCKETGKIELTGNETWNNFSTGNIYRYYTNAYQDEIKGLPTTTTGYCNYLTFSGASANPQSVGFAYNVSSGTTTTNGNLTLITTGYYQTWTDLTNWLKTVKPVIYYQLATPTTTEITNTELINQLESLYNAKSKNGTTNINVTSEDLSMILNVSVIKGDA